MKQRVRLHVMNRNEFYDFERHAFPVYAACQWHDGVKLVVLVGWTTAF